MSAEACTYAHTHKCVCTYMHARVCKRLRRGEFKSSSHTQKDLCQHSALNIRNVYMYFQVTHLSRDTSMWMCVCARVHACVNTCTHTHTTTRHMHTHRPLHIVEVCTMWKEIGLCNSTLHRTALLSLCMFIDDLHSQCDWWCVSHQAM